MHILYLGPAVRSECGTFRNAAHVHEMTEVFMWHLQLSLIAGSQILPPISDPSVGEAFLLVSFNTDSNNITYQLVADSVTELLVAHIHLPATSSMNGSVAIPLFQAQFDPIPGSTTSGLIAAATVTPATFVGPLEVLPDFTNVDVPTVLSEYVQQGRAYAQVRLALKSTVMKCHTQCCSH